MGIKNTEEFEVGEWYINAGDVWLSFDKQQERFTRVIHPQAFFVVEKTSEYMKLLTGKQVCFYHFSNRITPCHPWRLLKNALGNS